MPERTIDPLSTTSLFLNIKKNGRFIATATGFVVQARGVFFLITNKHVVLNEEEDYYPEALEITYHSSRGLGSWLKKSENLYENSIQRWKEHPSENIDVIALPLSNLDGVKIYPLDLDLANTNMKLFPAMPVSIIGYPFGIRVGGLLPVWKTGHIASDPDIDYNNKPQFLIDATTRGGMSGSPVVLRQSSYLTREGNRAINVGFVTKFLGIYSSRLMSGESIEIGIVWKPNIISEILNN